MCIKSSEEIPCTAMHAFWRWTTRKHNLRVHRLNRRRRSLKEGKEKAMVRMMMKADMEIKNWKLYMENKSIIQENQKLKMKALLLHQENQALLSQLQNKFSHLHNSNNNNNKSSNSINNSAKDHQN